MTKEPQQITRQYIESMSDEVMAYSSAGLGIDKGFAVKIAEALERLRILLPKTKKSVKAEKFIAKIEVKVNKPITFKRVSDHAIIRIMERKSGFNFDGIRSEITEEISSKYKAFGDGKYSLYDNSMTAVVKDGVVVTIL